jgi:hypothetical protein
MEDSSLRLIVDFRLSIASIVARQYAAQGQDCSILNRKSSIDNRQLPSGADP